MAHCTACGLRNKRVSNPVCGRCERGDPVEHGVHTTYTSLHCRCDACRLAYNAWRRGKHLPRRKVRRNCLGCGEVFLSRQHKDHAKYCGSCGRPDAAARRRRDAAARLAKAIAGSGPGRLRLIAGFCRCGVPVTQRARDYRQLRGCACCSDDCHVEHLRDSKKRQPGKHRLRARRYGVPYEPVNRWRVFKRDGWVCGICSEPVDRLLKYPDFMSASLDHVVPMSRGGAHSYDNVQCSHWICNVRKGAANEEVVSPACFAP